MITSAMSLRTAFLLPFLFVCLSCNSSFARGVKGPVPDGVYDADGKHWTILMEPNKKSCSMVVHFDEDAMVYIGEDDWVDDVLFYFIFMKKGLNFEKDEIYDVEVQFGKDMTWRKEALGARVGNYGGVYLRGLDGEFGVNFSQSGAFFVSIDGKDYGLYELTGTREGMLRLLKCKDDFDKGILPSR